MCGGDAISQLYSVDIMQSPYISISRSALASDIARLIVRNVDTQCRRDQRHGRGSKMGL
jgi:hypothetical protein